jgi:hypothetical protein
LEAFSYCLDNVLDVLCGGIFAVVCAHEAFVVDIKVAGSGCDREGESVCDAGAFSRSRIDMICCVMPSQHKVAYTLPYPEPECIFPLTSRG